MSGYAIYPSLKGRGVFVSGGGSGIGASFVEHFAAQGAHVAFVDLAEDASAALVDRIAAAGHPKPFFQRCDVTDTAAYQSAIAAANTEVGPLRVLVNNAARDDRHKIDDVTPEYWEKCLAVNLKHQFFAIQAAAPAMREAGGGSIVNMGSVSWMRSRDIFIGYATSKSAINGMTRSLARELGPGNIRVNCLVPGAIVTERQTALWRNPEEDARFLELQSLKFRLGPQHCARLALWLAADDSDGCTGQNFIVDGGLV
ncbi:MAG: SDR family NAD(P)-dependent oxidoreductase [Rhodospirillales bacterium]|jgi:NAD(P)-dependent dehydrogenase (short-subunit alcohol dehydrogenase family)